MNSLLDAIASIDVKQIDESDKKELLRFFTYTESPALRNQLAFIFADMNYTQAIPSILQKIDDKTLYNANGSLVFALQSLDTSPYFLDIVKILCQQGYEARLAAFDIIKKNSKSISTEVKDLALEILEKSKLENSLTKAEVVENSRLHFIVETCKLLTTE